MPNKLGEMKERDGLDEKEFEEAILRRMKEKKQKTEFEITETLGLMKDKDGKLKTSIQTYSESTALLEERTLKLLTSYAKEAKIEKVADGVFSLEEGLMVFVRYRRESNEILAKFS